MSTNDKMTPTDRAKAMAEALIEIGADLWAPETGEVGDPDDDGFYENVDYAAIDARVRLLLTGIFAPHLTAIQAEYERIARINSDDNKQIVAEFQERIAEQEAVVERWHDIVDEWASKYGVAKEYITALQSRLDLKAEKLFDTPSFGTLLDGYGSGAIVDDQDVKDLLTAAIKEAPDE